MGSVQKQYGANLAEFSGSTPKELDASQSSSENIENEPHRFTNRESRTFGASSTATKRPGVVKQTFPEKPGTQCLGCIAENCVGNIQRLSCLKRLKRSSWVAWNLPMCSAFS